MLRPSSVSTKSLDELLERARAQRPTYQAVGHTGSSTVLRGFRHDLHEREVGAAEIFERAKTGIARWQAHLGAGARVFPPDPVRENATVLVLLGFGPLVVVAPCRIVSVIDEPDRFGFAYGTLPGHPERGEERFMVERENDRCVFRISAFSRPGQLLVRLGRPVARQVQLRTTARYLESLARYVEGRSDP